MTPVALSKKAVATARDFFSSRQHHFSLSMSFSALGESQASKVMELLG